jgi:molybdopterin/thiamine biosynthesis adenylyltransferase
MYSDLSQLDTLVSSKEIEFDSISPIFFRDKDITNDVANLLKSKGVAVLDQSGLLQKEWERIVSLPNSFCHPRNSTEDRHLVLLWCYLPWRRMIVRLPQESAFITLRTARNLHKIRLDEQFKLKSMKVGVIGLSVGQSVVMPLVMERICGEIRIADFDVIELNNLNRIEAGVGDIGLSKANVTARRIAELDPYFPLKVFSEGITSHNIENFLFDGGKLDLVVEECDNGAVKLLTRILCRKHGIPIVMETSDRGLLDVERYDLEPTRPLLHGMLRESDYSDQLSQEEGRKLLIDTFDFSRASERGVSSMSEIGNSISTWPQLATDVIAGGATAAMAIKMILLGEAVASGRRYVDIQSIIRRDPETVTHSKS